MGFLTRIFDKSVYLYRGMVLTSRELETILHNGIAIPGYKSINDLQEDLQGLVDVRTITMNLGIRVDVKKYGFRQVPMLLGEALGDRFVGIYLTSDMDEALKYARGDVGTAGRPTDERRAYIFKIKVFYSEIFDGPVPENGVIGDNFLCSKAGKRYYWLDYVIPANRIVGVIDVEKMQEMTV